MNRTSRIHHPRLARNIFAPLEIMPRCSAARLDFTIIPVGFNAPLEFLTGFASRFYVFQLLASSSQTFFTSQSPAQTIFPLQEKRSVINFHSYNVYLSGCLIFEPVPYLHHSIVSFLDLLGDYPSTKRTTGLPVGELVLWCGMFAPEGRLEWYHGLARGAP